MNRRLLAEAVGTALLLYVIVGSGIAAESNAADPGVQLFAHAITVGLGLGGLIAMFQGVSGAHLNPSVTLAIWRVRSIEGREATRYVSAQVIGAIAGVVAASLSFGAGAVSVSTTARGGLGVVFAEAIATFVLVLMVLVLVRTDRARAVPIAVGAWVAAAVFATSSTGFANPAVTVARIFTDTYAGIAPASVPAFVMAQLMAGLAAAALAIALCPEPAAKQDST